MMASICNFISITCLGMWKKTSLKDDQFFCRSHPHEICFLSQKVVSIHCFRTYVGVSICLHCMKVQCTEMYMWKQVCQRTAVFWQVRGSESIIFQGLFLMIFFTCNGVEVIFEGDNYEFHIYHFVAQAIKFVNIT